MYTYSKQSRLKLDQCHPDLQLICYELLKYFDHSVLCGHRDKADQEAAFNSGNSKTHYPNSKHNKMPSMAVDLAPYPREKNKYADREKYCEMAGRFMQIASYFLERGLITHKIRWGRNWDMDKVYDDQTFNDYGHFGLIKA